MIMAQLLLTIDFMVRKNVIHRDLKPENILLNSKERRVFDIRIADFGLATLADDPIEAKKRVICGTAGYIPPEVLNSQKYSFKSDLFSAGSIMYSLLTYQSLFQGRDYETIMKANKLCRLSRLDVDLIQNSQESVNLIKQLLNPDPALRPTAAEALQHPWFKKQKVPLMSSL
jgi:calcium-dependent protein kinase